MRTILFLPILVLSSCSSNIDGVLPAGSSGGETDETSCIVIINEYAPRSNTLSEFNEEADWIELYNTSDSVFAIEKNTWFISDDPSNPEKYVLPAVKIDPHGHLVIWCDGKDVVKRDIHTNFKLSGKGEEIVLTGGGTSGDRVRFDSEVKKNCSYGRLEDGSPEWAEFRSPSPGTSNQSADNYAETLK